MRPRLRNLSILAAGAVAVLSLFYLELSWVRWVAGAALAGAGLLLVFYLLWRGTRLFLYKVGRRLAFSYLLLGALPIPMVMLLLLLTAYLLVGAFMGHLFRDGLTDLVRSLETEARVRLANPSWRPDGRPVAGASESGGPAGGPAFALYRQGRKVAGDPRAPEEWPEWVAPAQAPSPLPIFLLGDPEGGDRAGAEDGSAGPSAGAVTVAATAGDASRGVLAWWSGDLERALSERTDILVEMRTDAEDHDGSALEVRIGGYETVLKTLGPSGGPDPEAEAFFAGRAAGDRASSPGWIDRPYLRWALLAGPRLSFSDGTPLAEHTPVALETTPRVVHRHLFALSAELDAYAWVALLGLATLLFWIYVLAALMAVFLIYGLSSAVNRLSRATARVQRGDFSARIPVQRRDQLGDLQRSFNRMTANLEQSVAAAAQKEALDKELAIARDLQLSLVPRELPTGGRVEVATLFEPSAAIGGDYFDILRLSEDRMGVVVADVSGHGLPTGLRMAMLKAALGILVEKARRPEEILERLDAVVRTEEDSRFFVTAVLALLDLELGSLTLLNAGHPPTYLLRGGRVREILIPSAPLGMLHLGRTEGRHFGKEELELETGDLLVWLSDGLIEAADADGEPFGYERLEAALAGAPEEPHFDEPCSDQPAREAPQAVKERLLEAVYEHTGGERPADDLTLVVLRWDGPRKGDG